MNQLELFDPLNTRAHNIRMARVYIAAARQAHFRYWRATLLTWAGERRRRVQS